MDWFTILLIVISITGFSLTGVAGRRALAAVGFTFQFRSLTRKIWPSIVLLSGASLIALAIMCLAIANAMSLTLAFRMLWLGLIFSISSIVASAWTPRGVRAPAIVAAAIWMVGFAVTTLNLYLVL